MQTALKYRKAFTSNQAGASYSAAIIPQALKPSGAGVFNIFDSALGLATEPYVPESLLLLPYASAANNVTFNMRLYGWSQLADGSLWVPNLLLDLACTAGNILATALGVNNFLADTIVVTTGPDEKAGTGLSFISTTTDTPAHAIVGLRGAELIQFDIIKNTATDANCLWRPVSSRLTR